MFDDMFAAASKPTAPAASRNSDASAAFGTEVAKYVVLYDLDPAEFEGAGGADGAPA